MNLVENIKEGIRSIQSNILRSVLTALIIAIGITSLVGILTAIESIRSSVESNFSQLGANTFDIEGTKPWRRQNAGKNEKVYPPIKFKEAIAFKERFAYPSDISIDVNITGNAEAKYMSSKTNPNVRISGVNENFVIIKGLILESGRNFSNIEMENAANVAIIGQELKGTLFEKVDPINKYVSVLGNKYKIIGVLKKVGSIMGGGGQDRSIMLPITTASRISTGSEPTYDMTVAIWNPAELNNAIGEATGLMRVIRRDELGRPDSFEITQNDSVAARLNDITGYLQIGGFVIGFITLLGASIGLMNIMMVSVTERTREIGIRKALGATPLRIRQQFLIEAIVICQLGGILGVIFGILIGNFISTFISSGGFVVPWMWILIGLTICVGVGLLSGYYPAYKASKLDPIESLRFE
jgi:putative ABC transport system permease protein